MNDHGDLTDEELVMAAAEVFQHFDRHEAADERTAQLRDWALSVFCWDGLLPVAVIAIPNLTKFVLPNWQFGLAMVAIFSPVVAFSVRFAYGWARMRRGQAYIWQTIIFTVAISALFLCEAFILNDQFGGGPKIAEPTVLLVMFALYFTTVAIALFPFRVASSNRQRG
jgi:hypothetical protein